LFVKGGPHSASFCRGFSTAAEGAELARGQNFKVAAARFGVENGQRTPQSL
jgi:hypothetical protein